jgi:hypothetical protein
MWGLTLLHFGFSGDCVGFMGVLSKNVFSKKKLQIA